MKSLVLSLTRGLYEREEAVRMGLLAAMAGESLFLLGPPGVGKSLIARRLQMVFRDAKSFTYLMGRFSTPDEVFGPLSIRALKQDDRYERVITNYLPDADVVFLDEIWKASAPIRNALLTALNERLFRNGTAEIALPLKVFIGASNELPTDDETADAFWDRFLVRLVLGPVTGEAAFLQLINDTNDIYEDVVPDRDKLTREEYQGFQRDSSAVIVPERIGRFLVDVRDKLKENGCAISDRRWKKITHLLRTCAQLHDRTEVNLIDCAVVRHCVWNDLGNREAAVAAVDESLAEHAADEALVGRLSAGIRDLESQLAALAIEELEEEITSPVRYREEYYRLVARGPGGPESDSRDVILVWHGDVDDLEPDAAITMDVFRYDLEDTLIGSEEVHATRAGPWTVRINDQDYAIEVETTTGVTTRSRDIGGADRARMETAIRDLVRAIQEAIDRMASEQAELASQGREHLFVSSGDAETLVKAVVDTAERLVKLRLESEQLLARMENGYAPL